MQSMSENDFECLARTGVNAPETMFPNPRSREIQLPRGRTPGRVVGRPSTFGRQSSLKRNKHDASVLQLLTLAKIGLVFRKAVTFRQGSRWRQSRSSLPRAGLILGIARVPLFQSPVHLVDKRESKMWPKNTAACCSERRSGSYACSRNRPAMTPSKAAPLGSLSVLSIPSSL